MLEQDKGPDHSKPRREVVIDLDIAPDGTLVAWWTREVRDLLTPLDKDGNPALHPSIRPNYHDEDGRPIVLCG